MVDKKPAKQSLAERLASKAGQQVPEQPKSPVGKRRPTLELTAEQQLAVNEFLQTSAVLAVAKGRSDASYGVVRPLLARGVLQLWLDHGAKPENPNVLTDQGSCQIQAVSRNRFVVPRGSNGEELDIDAFLVSLGVPKTVARKVAGEVERTQVFEVVNPVDLAEKDAALAERLVSVLEEHFSPEEFQQIVKRREQVTIDDGFLSRLAGYCGKNVKLMETLIAATRMVEFRISQVNWRGGINQAVEKVFGLVVTGPAEAASPRMDVTVHQGGRAYQLVAEDSRVKVFSDSFLMLEKTCADHDHAVNTVKAWQKDPGKLVATLGRRR